MARKTRTFDFRGLVSALREIDNHLAAQSGKAVNLSLTLRNWMMGLYIAEYERHGSDRAHYGENLLDELSKELRKGNISNTGRRQLYNYLSLYRTYPE
ncbi:MAG: cytoplasmic protein, partial [Candidatus Edwardsbacteria bacterium]|nr:cytoplasmic protein [Candidatus Edwardsbacteria bacterium]